MYEHGTDSVIPSENLKEIESATVELCWSRPSGLTGSRGNIQVIHMILHSNVKKLCKTIKNHF
jgi:hypothetical protein